MSFHKHKKHEEVEENWLISYADMITLLICFFVIMLSVMDNKKSENEEIEAQIKEAFTGEQATTVRPFTSLEQQIQQMIEQQQVEEQVAVEETEKGLMLEIASSSFYESGSSNFKKEAIPILDGIAEILNNFDYEDYIVSVEGHTDDAPIKTAQFPSNWELSSVRASGVVRYFIDKGQPSQKMHVSAFAETQPKVPNSDEFGNPIAENREMNRRIVIRIERRE